MYLMVYHKLKLYLIPDMAKTSWYFNNDHIRITSNQINIYEYTDKGFEYMFMPEDFAGFTSIPSWMKCGGGAVGAPCWRAKFNDITQRKGK